MSSLALRSAAPTPVTPLPTRTIIYLGMDVHKDSITIAVFPADAKVPTRLEKVPNELPKLKKWMHRVARHGEIHACYEASGAVYPLPVSADKSSSTTSSSSHSRRERARDPGGRGARQVPARPTLDDRPEGPEAHQAPQRPAGRTIRTIEYLVKRPGPVSIQDTALKGGTGRTTVDPR